MATGMVFLVRSSGALTNKRGQTTESGLAITLAALLWVLQRAKAAPTASHDVTIYVTAQVSQSRSSDAFGSPDRLKMADLRRYFFMGLFGL